MVYRTDEAARLRRQRTEQAIRLAMQSRWDEAVTVNLSILEIAQQRDSDAFNRLGRALMALGRFKDARAAYGNALRLDHTNQIARKNLTALEKMAASESDGAAAPRDKVDPKLFVEETGKTGFTVLQRPNREALQRMTAGERVYLRREGNQLLAQDAAGDALGRVEPRIALRLLRFMDAGNEYAAAVAQVGNEHARIVIKETFQHSSQVGKLSFPSVMIDGTPRPYTREGLVRYDDEDEETLEEIDMDAELDQDNQDDPPTRDITLLDYQKSQEREDRDDNLFDE
jgi:tetratricopeptide (TPR) repeat protein